uniref:Lipoyl synthase, chloroplastic (Trinotate prediction) n=1 Tax=Henneguya salminicola TaxID=69463 RepID=A0A6G3MJ07_HENSL
MDKSIEAVATSGLNVFAHNIETVKRLQRCDNNYDKRYVRDPRANYNQSLSVLEKAKYFNTSLHTKSSIMLGFGESQEEVIEAMQDLRSINVDFLTIGQYMQPTKLHAKVIEYVNPKIFEFYEKVGLELGFLYIASGPLVRSSYRAGEYYIRSLVK